MSMRKRFWNSQRKFLTKEKELSKEKKDANLETILNTERIIFEEERRVFQSERKSFELKSAKLLKKISELQLLVKNERRKCVEKDFMSENKYFETKIKKLSRKLSELYSNIMKDQRMKSDLQKKFDLSVKERNKFSAKVKELEEIIFKVKLSSRWSPITTLLSLCDDLADSECSFKAATSSLRGDISSRNFFNSNNKILIYNLLYDYRVNGSSNNYFREGKVFWKIK